MPGAPQCKEVSRGSGDQLDLARERTDWAWQRNLLAEQRNFSAWMRTGLAALAVGFAAAKLLEGGQAAWAGKTLGSVLVAVGVAIHVLSFQGYLCTFRRIRGEGLPGLPIWSVTLITLALVASGLAMLALIFIG